MKTPLKSPAALLTPGRPLTFANVAEGAEGLVVSDLARAVAARPERAAIRLALVWRGGRRLTAANNPLIVRTTVNAIVQRVPAREIVAAQALSVAPGHVVPMDSIVG